MRVEKCSYDLTKDIQRTQPDMAINLQLAITEGVVQDTGDIPYYNDIEDPSTITGRINDVFEAMDAERSLKNAMANKPQNVSSGQAAAASSE